MPSLFSRLNIFSSNSKKKKKTAKKNDKRQNSERVIRRDEINLVQRLTSGDSNATQRTRNTTKSPNESMNLSGLSSTLSSTRNHDPHGDDHSIPTMDSDYNHVRSGNCSLSDAGGTLGSQSQCLTNFSHAVGWMTNPATGMLDDPIERRTYTDYYGNGNNDPRSSYTKPISPSSIKEVMVELYAPAGILGLVVDAPAHSPSPIIHAIKDTCPIKKQVYVGDKLVAVDDVDVRGMSATEVSYLIGLKSGQDRRKLTIIRTARGRNGMY